MNDKERAKMQVEDDCAETREEDLGFQMVKHYNYLSSLNNEWSNLCELAVKMYLPNKKYIDELEAKNKQLEEDNKKLRDFVEEVTARINPRDKSLARFYYYGLTVLKETFRVKERE